MTKHYEHAHRVQYIGANENDGMWLWGVWSIGGERGEFQPWPEASDLGLKPSEPSFHLMLGPAARQLDKWLPDPWQPPIRRV